MYLFNYFCILLDTKSAYRFTAHRLKMYRYFFFKCCVSLVDYLCFVDEINQGLMIEIKILKLMLMHMAYLYTYLYSYLYSHTPSFLLQIVTIYLKPVISLIIFVFGRYLPIFLKQIMGQIVEPIYFVPIEVFQFFF